MSRGIGKTQQRILDALAAVDPPTTPSALPLIEGGSITVVELAAQLSISDRQTRRAVRSLEERGLAVVTRTTTWHGEGKYGRLVPRQVYLDDYDIPVAKVIKEGERWPWSPDRLVAAGDTEMVHQGIPSPALAVWSVPNRIAYLELSIKVLMAWGGHSPKLPAYRAELQAR